MIRIGAGGMAQATEVVRAMPRKLDGHCDETVYRRPRAYVRVQELSFADGEVQFRKARTEPGDDVRVHDQNGDVSVNERPAPSGGRLPEPPT